MRRHIARCALFALMAGTAARANGQTTGMKLEDVVNLLSRRVSAQIIAQNAKDACIAFPMDSAADAELARVQAPRELVSSLRTTCFTGAILEIVTNPPGVDVVVDQRRVGASPYRARVAPTPSLRVRVGSGEQVQNFDVEVPKSTHVRVAFEMLEDTLPVPPERSARQIAEGLGLMQQWTPPVPRPAMPVAPAQQGSGFRSLMIGALTGAVGFAAASASPTPCHDKQVAAQDSYVGDKLYRAGTEVDLGLKPACAGGVGAGVAVVSALVARQFLEARSRGQMRGYETAKANYPAELARWDASVEGQRSTWLAANSQVNAALATQANERKRVQAANVATNRRNAARALPARSTTPITATTPLPR